jgi:hypothetical protein
VVHAHNPSYAGGMGTRITVHRQPEQKVQDPILKNN